jgi:predicted Ser/Thr protein kinase
LEFFKEKILGKGTFGKVFQGTYYKSPVAVKKLRNMHFSNEAMEDFTKEVKVLM